MRVASLRLLAVVATIGFGFGPGMSEAASNRRVAIVIENSDYQNAGSLPVVKESAKVVADAFRGAGFQVIVERNLDFSQLATLTDRLQNPLLASNFAVVYYAGLTLSINDTGFLLPVDAKLDSEIAAALDSVELNGFLEGLNGATYMSVVAIDPITQNPMMRSLAQAMGPKGDTLRPVPVEPKRLPSMIFALSVQPGASSGSLIGSGASPFAKALVEEILKSGAEAAEAMTAMERGLIARRTGRPFVKGALPERVVLTPPQRAEPPSPATVVPSPSVPPVEPPPPAVAETVDLINIPYVATKDVNLRQSPRGVIIGSIQKGTALTATGRARSSSSWVQVEVAGKLGFVHTENLADPTALAQSDAAKAPAPDPGVAGATLEPGEYAVSNRVSVFEKPALGARSNRELDEGSTVTVVGTAADGGWIEIRDVFVRPGYLPKRSALADLRSLKAEERKRDKTPPSPSVAQDDEKKASDDDQLELQIEPGLRVTLASEVERSAKLALGAVTQVSGPGGILAEVETAIRKAQEARDAARRTAEAAQSRPNDSFRKISLSDGGIYEGQWVDNARQGVGRYRYPNGDIYEGTWQNNLMQGYGVYQYANGDRYEGEMKRNQVTGYGTLYFSNGDVYKGRVSNALFHEYGSLAFKRGDRYLGQFSTGGITGHGVMTFPDGSRFIGLFQRGKQKGAGVFVFSDASYRQGFWDGPQSAPR